MLKFEVRIPAYERPELLFRALGSLVAQSYPGWIATVFDDSRSNAVEKVVSKFGDWRVSYVRNSERKGAAANIDDCFDPEAWASGSYGCLLEDDNYWMPGFLEKVASEVAKSSSEVFLVNQRVHLQGVGLKESTETTRGRWFNNGMVSPLKLRATLLLMEGLSNGGLVWKLGGTVDLRVGSLVKETALHEACRSLLVESPFQFIEEPLAVWTEMPLSQTARASESNRVIGRGNQAVFKTVFNAHGAEILAIAKGLGMRPRLATALASCGFVRESFNLGILDPMEVLKIAAKGLVLRLVQRNPCGDFLRTLVARKNSNVNTSNKE